MVIFAKILDKKNLTFLYFFLKILHITALKIYKSLHKLNDKAKEVLV